MSITNYRVDELAAEEDLLSPSISKEEQYALFVYYGELGIVCRAQSNAWEDAFSENGNDEMQAIHTISPSTVSFKVHDILDIHTDILKNDPSITVMGKQSAGIKNKNTNQLTQNKISFLSYLFHITPLIYD